MRSIREYQLPAGANIPEITEYDGTGDPVDHIEHYRWRMDAYYLDENIGVFFPNHPIGSNSLMV